MRRRLLAALSTLAVIACAATGTHRAPPLKVLRRDVKTEMGALADSIRDVEGILQSDASLTPGDAERVVELLATIDVTARRLDPSAPQFAHPNFAPHLPALRETAAAAVVEARAVPAKYTQFGRLTAVCNQCHVAPN